MLNKLVIILLDSPIWGHFQWPPWTITASWTQFQTPYSANSSFSFDCKKFLQWLDERWFWFCGPLTHWYSKCSCSSRGIPGGSWETQIDPHLQSSRPGTEVFSELKKTWKGVGKVTYWLPYWSHIFACLIVWMLFEHFTRQKKWPKFEDLWLDRISDFCEKWTTLNAFSVDNVLINGRIHIIKID